jgi:tRNA (uracil-5-)-methyltransferase
VPLNLLQVNFHTTLLGDSMVTLVYHKQLDDVWQEAARKLQAQLAKVPGQNGHTPQIIGAVRHSTIRLLAAARSTQLGHNSRL